MNESIATPRKEYFPRKTIDEFFKRNILLGATIVFLVAAFFSIIEFSIIAKNISKIHENITNIYNAVDSIMQALGMRLPQNSLMEIVDKVKVALIIENVLLPIGYCLLGAGALIIIIGFKKLNDKAKKIGLMILRIGAVSFVLYKLVSFICGIIEVVGIMSVLSNINGIEKVKSLLGFSLTMMLIIYPLVGLVFGGIFIIQICFGFPISYKRDEDIVGSPLLVGIFALSASFFVKINFMAIRVTFMKSSLDIVAGLLLFVAALSFHKLRGNQKQIKLTDAFKNVSAALKDENANFDHPVASQEEPVKSVIAQEKPVKRDIAQDRPVFSPQPKEDTYPPFEPLCVNIFDENFDVLDKRYSVLHKGTFNELDSAILFLEYQIIKDKLSDKTLLRIKSKNNCEVKIKSIELQLKLRDENDNGIGLIKSIVVENECEDGNDFSISTAAIVLPNDTFTGDVIVKKISFGDGLSYDHDIVFYLSSQDKIEKDIAKYINLHPVWEDR